MPPTAKLKCKVHECDVLNIGDVKQILCVIFKIHCESLQTLGTNHKKVEPIVFLFSLGSTGFPCGKARIFRFPTFIFVLSFGNEIFLFSQYHKYYLIILVILQNFQKLLQNQVTHL